MRRLLQKNSQTEVTSFHSPAGINCYLAAGCHYSEHSSYFLKMKMKKGLLGVDCPHYAAFGLWSERHCSESVLLVFQFLLHLPSLTPET